MPRTPNIKTPNKSIKKKQIITETPKSQHGSIRRSLTTPQKLLARASTSGATSTQDKYMRNINRMTIHKNKLYVMRNSKRNVGLPVKGSILRQIRHLQKSTKLLIPRLSFTRVVREITQSFCRDFRYRTDALLALQESAEDYLVRILSSSHEITRNRNAKTLQAKDMTLLTSILNES